MKKLYYLVICVFVVGCVSLQTRFTNTAGQIVELINAGSADELQAITQTPFLLDGEVILLEEDMADFWSTIIQAGFVIENAAIHESSPVDAGSFNEFGSSMEVQSFFQKYVSKKSHLAVVETDKLKVVFLLDRVKGGKLKILGFKGPIWLG